MGDGVDAHGRGVCWTPEQVGREGERREARAGRLALQALRLARWGLDSEGYKDVAAEVHRLEEEALRALGYKLGAWSGDDPKMRSEVPEQA